MIEFSLSHRLRTADGDELTLEFQAEFAAGSFVGVVGPSGAGKTSLLRMLAGLAPVDAGHIRVDGECWLDRRAGVDLKPQRRSVGFVFQDYALFPNLDVFDNVAYALPRGERGRVGELLELFGLTGLGRRDVRALSGGQKQRVALARAVARRPKLLLLDEPLSALDASLRAQLQDELAELHRRSGMTTLIVSHDLGEVFKLASLALQIEHGRIVRRGSPAEVFLRPAAGGLHLEAQILDIEAHDVVHVLSVLIGRDIVRIVATPAESAALRVGDRVAVSAKAVSPLPRGGTPGALSR